MSTDFKKVLVLDQRLDLTDEIAFGVEKGAANVSTSVYNAVSQSVSSHSFVCQFPSLETVCDRNVLMQSQITLKLTVPKNNGAATGAGSRPINSLPVQVGLTDSLCPYPYNSCVSVMTLTLNNNSMSVNSVDVLPQLLRLTDKKQMAKYEGFTPTYLDNYYNYADGVGSNNNPLGGYSLTSESLGSGRGSWVLQSISNSPNVITAPTYADDTVYITFNVTEPFLFLSPFIFGHPNQRGGMYGISNLNVVLNMNSGARLWRSSNKWGQTCSLYNFTNSRLLFNFLTPHPELLLSSRCVNNFAEYPRYITGNLAALPAAINGVVQTQVLRTSTIALNSIPDDLIIVVRKAMGTQGVNDSDSFAVISGISINFNNSSGLCSNMQMQNIWKASAENCSNQSYQEYSGLTTVYDATTGTGRQVPLTGSVVVLKFGKDIQINESYYASASLGNFALQVNLSCYAQADAITNPEIVIITRNSGVLTLNRGVCGSFLGILSKADVIEASTQEPYYEEDVKRMVGSGWMDSMKSLAGKVLPKLPSLAKNVLGMVDNPYAQKGSDLLGALGAGRSGGGYSGGGSSGGKHKLSNRIE